MVDDEGLEGRDTNKMAQPGILVLMELLCSLTVAVHNVNLCM